MTRSSHARSSTSLPLLAVAAAFLLAPACKPPPAPPVPSAAADEGIRAVPEADALVADESAATPAPDAVSPVRRLEPVPSAEVRERALGEFRVALQLQRGGDSRGAVDALVRAGEALPAMRDWAHMLAAEAAAVGGDTAGVRRQLDRAEPTRARERGWRIRERAHRLAGDTLGALRLVEAAAPQISDPVRRADALRLAGELRVQRRDTAGALAAYRSAMEAAPQARAARDAAAALPDVPRAPADRLLEGRVWLRHGNVERGAAAIDAYLASGEGSAAARAEVQLQLGRALFTARRYRDAERHLLAAARAPGVAAVVAAEATLLAGRAQFRDGRHDVARRTLVSTADRFPREASAARALFILGDLDQDAGRIANARSHFQRASQLDVDAPDAALSAVRLAGILMLEGDARGAARVLDAFAEGRPEDRPTAQARYWAARAYQAAGDEATARQRFDQARHADPVSYYGSLATGRLGGSLADLELAPAPKIDEATQRAAEIALFRVDFLRELGLDELAAFELERARDEIEGRPGALYLIAEAHIRRGAPVAGMLLGREIQRREGAWNDRLLRIVYPFPHRELIEREARRNGLDPFLVAGLIRQESMFNPLAVSPAGAVGLMQIMPATGRMLARSAGVRGFEPAMLRDPDLNVRLGTRFLADLLARNGNPTEAFAAYNAGPSRLARWRSLPEARDEELFAERIPFTETRDYVKILNFNRRIYRLLYQDT